MVKAVKCRKTLKKWVKEVVNCLLMVALFVGMLAMLGGAVLQESYKLTPRAVVRSNTAAEVFKREIK
jgi:hypothetical protein